MYFNIENLSPSGARGTHTAFRAESVIEAATMSPVALTACSQYSPEDITVLAAYPTPEDQLPLESK